MITISYKSDAGSVPQRDSMAFGRWRLPGWFEWLRPPGGHSQLVSAYHMIGQQVEYHDLGAAYFDTLERDRRAKHLVSRVETMGYHGIPCDYWGAA